MDEPQKYLAFLLRLWQVGSNGETVWRVSVENSHTAKRYGFANLEQLFVFLEEQTGQEVNKRPAGSNPAGR